MNLEVFLFGASNNGAVTHPNTDSAYFEGYFFQTAKEEERGKPIMDVRIREKEGHTYVDYSILLNGLASVSETKEVGRHGANVGITYRLEGLFPDFERAYYFLMSEFMGAIYGTLLDKERTKFLRTIDEFKKLPGILEQQFVQKFNDRDIEPLPSVQNGKQQIIYCSTQDINDTVINRAVLSGGIVRVSDLYPSKRISRIQAAYKKNTDDMNAKHNKELKDQQMLMEQMQGRAREQADSLKKDIHRLESQNRKLSGEKSELQEKLRKIADLLDINTQQFASNRSDPYGENGSDYYETDSQRKSWFRRILNFAPLVNTVLIIVLLLILAGIIPSLKQNQPAEPQEKTKVEQTSDKNNPVVKDDSTHNRKSDSSK